MKILGLGNALVDVLSKLDSDETLVKIGIQKGAMDMISREQMYVIRKYQAKPVEPEKIRQMIQAAILAPSWKNSQVTRYYVAQSEEALQKLREALPEFNRNNTKDAPVLIVSTIVKGRSGYNVDGTASNELEDGWGCYDCGMQNMNLLLKATELGLGTLVMGIRDAGKLKEVFEIPEEEIVVSVIGVGYADVDPEMPKRKSVDETAKFY